MRRGFRVSALALLLTVAWAPARAGTVAAPDCSGVVAPASTAVCAAEFQLTNTAVFASLLDTHAGIHDGLGAGGRVSLKWFDAADKVVLEYSCVSVGLGITELTRALCDETVPMAEEFTPGAQTLIVTVLEAEGCPPDGCTFHGRLALHESGDLI